MRKIIGGLILILCLKDVNGQELYLKKTTVSLSGKKNDSSKIYFLSLENNGKIQKSVRQGNPLYVKFENYNPLKQKIIIRFNNVEYTNTEPKLFTQFFQNGPIPGLLPSDFRIAGSNVDQETKKQFVKHFKVLQKARLKATIFNESKIPLEDSNFYTQESLVAFYDTFLLLKAHYTSLNEDQKQQEVDLKSILFEGITEGFILKLIEDGYELKKIKNKNYFVSTPFYPNGNKCKIDIVLINHDFNDKNSLEMTPKDSMIFSREYHVKNKWFLGFSTGPFMAFGNNVRQATYGWNPIPENNLITDTSRYKLIQTGNSTNAFGLAAFANYGTKLCTNFGFGFTVGGGLTIEAKPKQAYFLGGSLFFGDDKQLNLSGGFSFIQVEKLNTAIYGDIQNTIYKGTQKPIDYKTQFVTGGFISLSYSIFSKK